MYYVRVLHIFLRVLLEFLLHSSVVAYVKTLDELFKAIGSATDWGMVSMLLSRGRKRHGATLIF